MKKFWVFIRLLYVNPNIDGVIDRGFLIRFLHEALPKTKTDSSVGEKTITKRVKHTHSAS